MITDASVISPFCLIIYLKASSAFVWFCIFLFELCGIWRMLFFYLFISLIIGGIQLNLDNMQMKYANEGRSLDIALLGNIF